MTLRSAGWLAAAGMALLFVAGVLLRPAVPVDEPRYLSAAWEMWVNGDPLVPTLNYQTYSHKPPLLFWTINLVWAVTGGVSEIAARLVAPAWALLGLLLTGVLARRLWPLDATVGARAVLAQAGLITFGLSASLTMFDAMLTTMTVAGMLALVEAARTGRRSWWAAVGVAIAAGVLTKGPVILLHLGPAILSVPFWAPGPARMPVARVLRGTGLALLVALCVLGLWLIPALILGGPDYRRAVLWTQSAGRISDSFAHAEPWYHYLAKMPGLLFPWLLVPGLWRAGWRQSWAEPGLKLALVWGLSALVLFSAISGKQTQYLLPELPAVALIVARLTRDAGRLWLGLPTLVVAAAGLAGLAGVLGLLPLGEAETLLRPLWPLAMWAVLLLALAAAAWRLGGLGAGVVLSLGVLLATNLLIGLTDTRRVYDTHTVARLLAPHEDAGIAFTGRVYQGEFTLAGRLHSRVANPETMADLHDWMAEHPRGVIVGRPETMDFDWEPRQRVLFRNSPHAIWYVEDAPPESRE